MGPLDGGDREGLAAIARIDQPVEREEADAQDADSDERQRAPGHVTGNRLSIEMQSKRFVEIVARHLLASPGASRLPGCATNQKPGAALSCCKPGSSIGKISNGPPVRQAVD
jgi:hypothetical protein